MLWLTPSHRHYLYTGLEEVNITPGTTHIVVVDEQLSWHRRHHATEWCNKGTSLPDGFIVFSAKTVMGEVPWTLLNTGVTECMHVVTCTQFLT